MAQGIIVDNWSLQDITNLLVNGMDNETAHEIVIGGDSHDYQPISFASIQTEALFDLLTDIVLRDEILVEERFEHAWNEIDSPILQARDLGVVRSYPFLNEPEKLQEPKRRIIEHMVSTPSLKIAHQENVLGWKENGQTPHSLLSATMWGGAGMCARSFVYEKSYTPHPLRKRFFINSGFMLPADIIEAPISKVSWLTWLSMLGISFTLAIILYFETAQSFRKLFLKNLKTTTMKKLILILTVLLSLYACKNDKKTNSERIKKIIEKLEKDNFITLENEITETYKVLTSFNYLKDIITTINIPEEIENEIPE